MRLSRSSLRAALRSFGGSTNSSRGLVGVLRRSAGRSRIVDELLAGERHAAALITFSRFAGGRQREWRELALYRVVEGLIADARAYEEPEDLNASEPR